MTTKRMESDGFEEEQTLNISKTIFRDNPQEVRSHITQCHLNMSVKSEMSQ